MTGEHGERSADGGAPPPPSTSAPAAITADQVERLAFQLRDVMQVPTSTYRVQLNASFTFADLRAILPYLDQLGVGAVYLSPCLKARPGSPHGYDVVDHREINPELGTREDFDALAREVQQRGMGLVLDTVPNHMAVDPIHNPYWRDVLQNGPSAAAAEWFDIDWQPVKASLHGRVLLPILGDQYGVVLERGELQVALDAAPLVLRYFDHVFPINPSSVPQAFQPEVDELKADPALDERDKRELLSVMTAFAKLPSSLERDPGQREERQRESVVTSERFAALLARSADVRAAIDRGITRLNGTPGSPASFDALHALIEQQAYRLAYWRTAFDEINYRRFFDINELGAVRMEDPAVFAEAHRLVLDLVRSGAVTALRLDHPDGLYDPEDYFEQLQAVTWRSHAEKLAGPDQPALVEALVEWRQQRRAEDPLHWAVRPLNLSAEKILASGESFRPRWAINGGTGYLFLNIVNGVFIDRGGLHQLRRLWARLSDQDEPFQEIAYESRRLIAQSAMASEMNVLAHALEGIAAHDRRSRDFTLNSLRRVLREIVASFHVYRTYVTRRGVSVTDSAVIQQALAEARRRSPVMESSIFEFIERVLKGLGPNGEPDDACIQFAMRFQQITGPIQAKGLEDTAFYRYVPLLATNEVGSDPAAATISIDQFHAANVTRLANWPATMLTLATHDTKRGADARARLTALSHRAADWRRAVARWSRTNTRHRQLVNGVPAPDRADEYHFYQALLAIWPSEPETDPIPQVAPADVEARLSAYAVKAIREAKIRSSWLRPDQVYEEAVAAFVRAILTGPGASRFLSSFVPFARGLSKIGALHGLSQHLLMCGVPGVPDIYQGSEIWHLCLVDPDNRQPVDFSRLQGDLDRLVPDLDRAASGEECTALVDDLAAGWHDGRLKLWVAAATLRHRRSDAALFRRGTYVPLAANASDPPVIAFARSVDTRGLIVIAPQHAPKAVGKGWITGAAWGDASVTVPEAFVGATLRDRLTGRTVVLDSANLRLADVLTTLPFAWLCADQLTGAAHG